MSIPETTQQNEELDPSLPGLTLPAGVTVATLYAAFKDLRAVAMNTDYECGEKPGYKTIASQLEKATQKLIRDTEQHEADYKAQVRKEAAAKLTNVERTILNL